MDVKVYDSEYVRALEASVVIGGRVNESGQLVLERGNGEEFNAGQVVPDLDTRWPLGAVYMSYDSTDPQVALGGGVWERLKDRILIGVGDNPRWDAAGDLSGSEKVTLTVDQMPSHDHTEQGAGGHNHGGETVGAGEHTHNEVRNSSNFTGVDGTSGPTRSYMIGATDAATGSAGTHVHALLSDGQHTHDIDPTGGGQPHDNIPPVLAVFMWRRTA